MLRRSARRVPKPPPTWLSDPPVGSLFLITDVDRLGDVLVRLPGFRENTGQLRFRLVPTAAPDDHSAEYPSVPYLFNKCQVVQLDELRRSMVKAVSGVSPTCSTRPPTSPIPPHLHPCAGGCCALPHPSGFSWVLAGHPVLREAAQGAFGTSC